MILCPLTAIAAGPRYDLSANSGRSDTATQGWTEWAIGEVDSDSRSYGPVQVRLRGLGAPLKGFLRKAGLATGATAASDGIRCEGDAIEITIAGLPAGTHSLATYHNLPSGKAVPLTMEVDNHRVRVSPTTHAAKNWEAATGYVEFESHVGPVTIRIAQEGGQAGAIVLNAIEIDSSNPAKRAIAPNPADFDGHADGDKGSVELSWRGSHDTSQYQVFIASAATLEDAKSKVANADKATIDTSQAHCKVKIQANDSHSVYAWRVDAVDQEGILTRGEVWSFQTRQLAFPGAEGYGRFARGGRRGRVTKVTNLDDSGPGSLRAAIEADGPRTVVFDVSGRITLDSRLIVRNDQLTIAGQTAPGKGICVSNYNLGALGAEDLIIRYLRVRPGDTSGKTLDGMGLASCDHAIVDHCSISWTQDEAFSSRGARNITLQRTLISEALNIAGHKKYAKGKAHGFAASIGGDIGSFHHNLLAHCAGRNWSLAGGVDQANRHRGQLDIRNNVVYNWDYRTTDGGARQVQFVGNYYKPGPATRTLTYLNPQFENPSFGPQQYYVEGNLVEGVSKPEGPTGPFAGMKVSGSQPWPVTLHEPFFPPYVKTRSAQAAYHSVLSDVGCSFPQLDDHDLRVIRETRQGTTTYVGSKSGKPGLPDSQEDVGGWEEYPEVHRPDDWDPDNDGMPTAWETTHGLDPSDPADGAVDPDGDGYTNLEDYLNGVFE